MGKGLSGRSGALVFGLVGRSLFHGREGDEENEDGGTDDGDERADVKNVVPVP